MTLAERHWKVGVIGAGKHGSRYARHIIHDVAGLDLTAISRRSEEGRQQAAQWGCRRYADWRQLVADPGVDCVIAVVPPVLNREVAVACAEAGKPLLLEKPMAVTVADAEAVSELVSRHALVLTIGQTLRYNRVVRLFREYLENIGTLYSFNADLRLEPTSQDWLDEPALAGAGVSFHTAVHVFDALRYITGREIVRVMARTRRIHTTNLEDHLVVLVELDNGVIGTVDCSKISPSRSGRFEFVGGMGRLQGDQVHHFCELIQGRKSLLLDPGPPVSTLVPLLTDWLGFLRGQQPNPIPGGEGLAAIRIAEACLRSAGEGRWVQV